MQIDPLGFALLTIARNAIDTRFGHDADTVVSHPDLSQPRATFVTPVSYTHLDVYKRQRLNNT